MQPTNQAPLGKLKVRIGALEVDNIQLATIVEAQATKIRELTERINELTATDDSEDNPEDADAKDIDSRETSPKIVRPKRGRQAGSKNKDRTLN
ncbi:MAG: hypothetical protein ACR2PG_06985 [Hyphomicrobiaceae bacterium]